MKRGQPPLPQEKTPKGGKNGPSPSYAQVAKSQAPTEEGDASGHEEEQGKKREKGEEGEGPYAKSTGNCRQTEVEALHAHQVGRRHQGSENWLHNRHVK